MADVAAPDIIYGIDRSGAPVAIIEQTQEVGREAVLERYPGIASGEFTLELAKLVNHFAREYKYQVIEDIEAFEAGYRARIAEEDPDATWKQGVTRLRDYGMPDFAQMHRPRLDGGMLVFFAESQRLGVPYRVEAAVNGTEIGEAKYEPVRMLPIE